jgi:hypothetical protein
LGPTGAGYAGLLHVDAPSSVLSLARAAVDARMRSSVTVQRFDETINGREYRIEVSAVGSNTWRA